MTDPLLPAARAPRAGAEDRIRAALRREAALPRPPGWRRSAVTLAGTGLGLLLTITAAGLVAGAVRPEVLAAHLAAIAPALGVCLLAAVAAFMPGGKALRRAALLLGLAAAALLVASRVEPAQASTSPGWVCTASHLATALLPALVALTALRRLGFDPLRSVAAGLSVGAVGALVGELVCEQGPVHVLWFHLPAWGAAALAITLLSTRLTRSSHAP